MKHRDEFNSVWCNKQQITDYNWKIHCMLKIKNDTYFVEYEIFTDEEETNRHDAGKYRRNEPG